MRATLPRERNPLYFVKMHKMLKITAMAAGVSDRLWSVGDIVGLIEAAEAPTPDMGEMLVK
jgi:hypothetical protein